MYPFFFFFLFVCCFYVLTNIVLCFFPKWHDSVELLHTSIAPSMVSSSCLRTFRLESLTGRCRLQKLTGRLFEKQLIVCNFKVTICVTPWRLMDRLGEVVAHGESTLSQIPLQGFPSPVYPALHEHLYEPTVFWHTELTSQEWEPVVHSSKSKK